MGFDRQDAVLLLRMLLAGALLTIGMLWMALALGIAWRVFVAVAG